MIKIIFLSIFITCITSQLITADEARKAYNTLKPSKCSEWITKINNYIKDMSVIRHNIRIRWKTLSFSTTLHDALPNLCKDYTKNVLRNNGYTVSEGTHMDKHSRSDNFDYLDISWKPTSSEIQWDKADKNGNVRQVIYN